MRADLRLYQTVAHKNGFHVVQADGKDCTVCGRDVEEKKAAHVSVNHRRRMDCDQDFGWMGKDDLYIQWKDVKIFFVVVSQFVSGTTNEKLLQHLAYNRDGLYPGILVFVSNDDNFYCDRQIEYIKRKGGENVFFAWESRLGLLFKTVLATRSKSYNLAQTLEMLSGKRSILSSTRLNLEQFKRLVRLRTLKRLQDNGEMDAKKTDALVEKKLKKLDAVFPARTAL